MLPITRKISEYNHSDGNDIKYIVTHDTGNESDTAESNANYFNDEDRQASAHYFVDENSIYQVVEEYNAAWHCGDGHMQYGIGNHNSIGIEMCNTNGIITDATMNNTIELVEMLMDKYNIPIDNVVRHYDASRKDCPHNMSANNWAKWHEFKSKLSQPVYDTNFIKSVQHDLQRIGCLGSGEGNATGNVTDQSTKDAIKQFRYIADLPSGENVDSQLVNALNAITQRPIIGLGWTENIYATKYIQWYLGLHKTGKWDAGMVDRVKGWQIDAKIWSASGADGVIRGIDWSKILK